MIFKGDVIRLFNPSEPGLRTQSHMHIVTEKTNCSIKCEREFIVCTTSPYRYIKQGIPFIDTSEKPFKEPTYIRLNPIYNVEDVLIHTDSRTNPYKLSLRTEEAIEKKIKNSKIEPICRKEFINLNKKYAIPTK